MKVGDRVRLVQPIIEGDVIERRINPFTDELEHLVQWTDAAGEAVLRWLPEAALEAAPQPTNEVTQ